MTETWYLLQSGQRLAAENMAVDEALLEMVARFGYPVLRFYGWMEPAATFGYSQRYQDIAQWTQLRPLIRRPTGGGLVPHDADWTYSLAVPPGHEWYQLKAIESYRRVHEWVNQAFKALEITTSLAPDRRKEAPGQCFMGAERFDLLWSGKKIAGAAQRRNQLGLLIQGSVQPPPTVRRTDWEEAMCQGSPTSYQVKWSVLEPDADLLDRVEQLRRDRYSQTAYNEQR